MGAGKGEGNSTWPGGQRGGWAFPSPAYPGTDMRRLWGCLQLLQSRLSQRPSAASGAGGFISPIGDRRGRGVEGGGLQQDQHDPALAPRSKLFWNVSLTHAHRRTHSYLLCPYEQASSHTHIHMDLQKWTQTNSHRICNELKKKVSKSSEDDKIGRASCRERV